MHGLAHTTRAKQLQRPSISTSTFPHSQQANETHYKLIVDPVLLSHSLLSRKPNKPCPSMAFNLSSPSTLVSSRGAFHSCTYSQYQVLLLFSATLIPSSPYGTRYIACHISSLMWRRDSCSRFYSSLVSPHYLHPSRFPFSSGNCFGSLEPVVCVFVVVLSTSSVLCCLEWNALLLTHSRCVLA